MIALLSLLTLLVGCSHQKESEPFVFEGIAFTMPYRIMARAKSVITVLLSLLTLLVGCSHQKESEPLVFEGIAFTMPYRILVERDKECSREVVEELIEQHFRWVDKHFNSYNPHSEISRFNQSRAFQRFDLSDDLSFFLRKVDEMVELTEGRFDPTVGALCHLWKSSLKEGREPQDQLEALDSLGWSQIHHDGKSLWKEHDATALDFGGIAKGYAVDELVKKLKALGFEHIYVEWGGEIALAGGHSDSRPWCIGIRGSNLALEMDGGALASSGNYLQKWQVASKTYTHIIDPRNGLPLEVGYEGPAAVTIWAPNCLLADALATSLMLFDTMQEALEWLEEKENPSIRAWLFR